MLLERKAAPLRRDWLGTLLSSTRPPKAHFQVDLCVDGCAIRKLMRSELVR